MTDPFEHEPELIAMVRRVADCRTPVPRAAAIFHDLQIYGNDAVELLDTLTHRWGVSFAGFNFQTYFPNEKEYGPLSFCTAKLGFRDRKRQPLTVARLLAVIHCGAWFEPP